MTRRTDVAVSSVRTVTARVFVGRVVQRVSRSSTGELQSCASSETRRRGVNVRRLHSTSATAVQLQRAVKLANDTTPELQVIHFTGVN